MATNVMESAAGKKIPNPLIPIIVLEAAITVAIIGNNNSKVMVFSGTPEAIESRIACLRKKISIDVTNSSRCGKSYTCSIQYTLICLKY